MDLSPDYSFSLFCLEVHETAATLFQFKVYNPICRENRIGAGVFYLRQWSAISTDSVHIPSIFPRISSRADCAGLQLRGWWHTEGKDMVKHSPHTWIGACPSFINSGLPNHPFSVLQALIHPSPFSFPSFSDYAVSSQVSPILQKPQKGAGMCFSLSHGHCTPADGNLCTAVAWSWSQLAPKFGRNFPPS